MRSAVRFAVVLVLGLALVAWLTSVAVHQTTRSWFEKALALRAQLVLNGARQALLAHWRRDQRAELQKVLAEIARDERVMAAGACAADLATLATTRDYPGVLGCS